MAEEHVSDSLRKKSPKAPEIGVKFVEKPVVQWAEGQDRSIISNLSFRFRLLFINETSGHLEFDHEGNLITSSSDTVVLATKPSTSAVTPPTPRTLPDNTRASYQRAYAS